MTMVAPQSMMKPTKKQGTSQSRDSTYPSHCGSLKDGVMGLLLSCGETIPNCSMMMIGGMSRLAPSITRISHVSPVWLSPRPVRNEPGLVFEFGNCGHRSRRLLPHLKPLQRRRGITKNP